MTPQPCCGDETWRPCFGFAEQYEISSWGNLRSRKTQTLLHAFMVRGTRAYTLSAQGRKTSRGAWRLFVGSFFGPRLGGKYQPRDGDRNHLCRANVVFVEGNDCAAGLLRSLAFTS